jgi:hypothetical protein
MPRPVELHEQRNQPCCWFYPFDSLVELLLDPIHLEENALLGVGEGISTQELTILISVISAILRIDDPYFRNAHCSVVFELALEPLHRILR